MHFFVQIQYGRELEVCSPSETHPESLPPPLVFALLYIYISGCKMLSSSLPLPILHMEVMDGKEIQRLK